MTFIIRLFLLVSLGCSSGFIVSSPLFAFDEPMMSIKTGDVTGVYYAAGSAVAKMHNRKRKEYNLRLITEASQGSVVNIEDVLEKKAGFGIAQANFLYSAARGEGFWKGRPQNNLRAVFGLYTEDYTVIAAADAGIERLADLKGKRVNIGEPGSSDALQAAGVFDFAGFAPQDVTLLEQPTYEAAELLQEGKIDAYLYTVGHPNLSIIEASSGTRKIEIVPLPREMIEQFSKTRPYLTATDVLVDYYPNIVNKEPVPTLGVKAILFTIAEMDEQVVYNVVKAVFENFDLFTRQHPALAKLSVERMTTGLMIPLHPGAKRYFQEAGLLP